MFMKAVKYFLGILTKNKAKSTPLFGKSKQKFQLYEYPDSGPYQLLIVAISPKHNSEWAVYRSEKTGVCYTHPMREFKEKFKEFYVGI